MDRVTRSPVPPIAHTSPGFLKGASNQNMDIKDTTENPT